MSQPIESPAPPAQTDGTTGGPAPAAANAAVGGRTRVPPAVNETVRSYAPNTPERAELLARLEQMAREPIDIPVAIGGERLFTGDTAQAVMPHDHRRTLATWHKAGQAHVERAIAAAAHAQADWANWPWEDRAAVFLKAADLASTTWRATLNAATMLGQSKTAHQAEIDSACELIDFFRFNANFAQQIYEEQPLSDRTAWNQLDYRPLEGFTYAVSPFNFTAIGANLVASPAMMGNAVLWKPASAAILSAWYVFRLLEEAGCPPGVVNFVPGQAEAISNVVFSHRDLAGVHFTGSTPVFQGMWKAVGDRIARYRTYPRLVGETGGKNFIVAHQSADPAALAVAMVRGGFEYQGQKCSAASRVYVPRSLWPEVRDRSVAMIDRITMGDVRDFHHFMGAVIDEKAFVKISEYLADAARSAKVIAGGTADRSTGYFIAPTLVEAPDAGYRLLCEEIFGPVVTVHVYADDAYRETLDVVDRTSPYALTGAIFARDRGAIRRALVVLRQAAGNFYINDKPTGAVVGQQPFGGARASGTNDKAGSKLNLLRWTSVRTIKETFVPPTDYRYPYMS